MSSNDGAAATTRRGAIVRRVVRHRVGVAVAAATVAALAVLTSDAAYAGHQASDVASYTGCLTSNGGTLVLIQEGDSPQRPCPDGSTVAHFSGGDITQIIAGDGLTGGGDNGSVTISLRPGYALPQGCTTGQSVTWSGTGWTCADVTRYTAGTGLQLNNGQFSIADSYQLPQDCSVGQSSQLQAGLSTSLPNRWGCNTFVEAGQSCPSGQFNRGVDSSGTLQCATPSGSGGIGWVDNKQMAYETGAGIPDDDAFHVYASVTPDAGTYLITAKGVIESLRNVGDFHTVTCAIMSNADVLDEMQFSSVTLNNVVQVPFALTAFASVSSTRPTIDLACQAISGADGISLQYGRISGIQVS